MAIEVASVEIPTRLNLSGFNSGLSALGRTKIEPLEAEVKVCADIDSAKKERQQLEHIFAKPIVFNLELNITNIEKTQRIINDRIKNIPIVKIFVNDTALYDLNKHVESKRSHIKDFNNWSKENPLKVNADSKLIDSVSTKLDTAENRIKNLAQYSKKNSPNKTVKENEKLQKYEPKIISSKDVANQIEKGFSQAKPRLGVGVIGSIFKGGLEKIGSQLTTGFSEGLSGSINDAISGSIGSFDLLGRSIFDKVIPGIFKGLNKAPVAKAITKSIGESKLGQTARDALRTTRGIIGEDEIAIEQRINKSKKRNSVNDRHQVAAREFGTEYQETLSRSGLNEIDRNETEKQIQQLTKQRSNLQRELNNFMSMTLDEKVISYFENQINFTAANLKKLQSKQKQLESEAQALVSKIDSGGTLTPKEQARQGAIESQYAAVEKQIYATQSNLSDATTKRNNFSSMSDEEKEALTGGGIKGRMDKVSEVEKQLEAARKRLESVANQKNELERLLNIVGIKGAGKLEGVRVFRDRAIADKKAQTLEIKSTFQDKIDKAQKLLTDSKNKVEKARQQLKEAVAMSEDAFADGLRDFISKEEKRQQQIGAGIGKLSDTIKKLEESEANFIERANKSVPTAEYGVIQEAGINKGLEELGKDVAVGNVENISKEYKKLLSKIQNLEFESNAEMQSVVFRMQSMNEYMVEYEKQAEVALKHFHTVSRGVTAPTSSALPGQPVRGKQKQAGKAVPEVYRSLVNEVGKASRVKITEAQIPTIQAWTPKQIQALAAKGITAEAAYVADKNMILVRQEQLDQLKNGQVTPKLVENIVHELRHSVQNAFGQIDPRKEQRSAVDLLRPSTKEMQQIGNLIEISTRNAYDASPQEEGFIRKTEQDAYTFALRNTKGIYNKVARPAKIQRIEQVGGAGGYKLLGNIDQLQAEQLGKLSKSLSSATYDVSSAESKLEAKFAFLRKTAEKYINQIANIDDLSDIDLDQLEQTIDEFAKQSAEIASKFSESVEKELFESAKTELNKQLAGGSTSREQLRDLAKSFNVGTGGTKEDISKRLLANVDFADLKQVVPQMSLEQVQAANQAEILAKDPNDIRATISENIKESRQHLASFKKGLNFESPIPNLEKDYNLVLELLSHNLETDIKKYLQGAKLQIGNLLKQSKKVEEELLASPDMDSGDIGSSENIDVSGLQLAGKGINPLEVARRQFRQARNGIDRNKATKANVRADKALQKAFDVGLEKQEKSINQAIAEFDKIANKQYEEAIKAVEKRLAGYDEAILKADELVFEQMKPENQIAINESQNTLTANNRLLSQQEAKGNIVNYDRLRIPQATDEDTGEFKAIVGEALGDFFSGVAERVRKQAKILENEVPSLMTDLTVSATQATEDEATQLNNYRDKLEALMGESRELSAKNTLNPEEVKRLADVNKEIQNIFDTFGRTVPQVNQFFDVLVTGGDVAAQAGNALKNLAVGFLTFKSLTIAIDILKQFAPVLIESATAMESLERRFSFVSGSFSEGAKNLEFVRNEVKRLGTDVKASMEGFTSLAGATRDTSLEGEATRQIFSGVSQASTVYDLNAEQQGRVFTAVQQMASKGKVSSEELRQQLGESLPGAFQIAARAMGVTTAQLNKMLEQGQVVSEDFLPKFAQQLSAETSSGVAGAANSSVSALIGFNNVVFETQAALGKQLLPVRNFGLQALSQGLTIVKDNAEILMSAIKFLALYIGVNAAKSIFSFVGGLKILGGQALLSAGGLKALGVAAKGALVSAAPMLATFIAFNVVSEIFQNLAFSFSDAGGSIRNFAETSKKGLGDFRKALKEAKGEQQEFTGGLTRGAFVKQSREKDRNNSFLWNITGANFIRNNITKPLLNPNEVLGKKPEEKVGLFDRLKAVGSRFGDIGKPKAVKELDDKVAATREAIASSTERIGLSKGAEVQGIIKQVQTIDKQLRSVQMQRRATVTTNPKDVDTIKRLKREEEALLKNRERLYKPVGAMQSQYQADVDGLKAALEEYEELRKAGNIDDKTYAEQTGLLKNQLDKAEKAQRAFTTAIGENISASALLAKQFKEIADRLTDASSAAQKSGNIQKAALYSDKTYSPEQRAFAAEKIDINVLEEQAKQNVLAFREQMALLMTPENMATLQAYGANKDTGAAQFKTLAERAGDDSPDAKVFEQFAVLKEQELQTSELQAQLAQRRAEIQQKLYDLTKQVEEYYRGIARQSAETELQIAKQMSELDNQQFANQINAAMLGTGDNIVSQFVGSILDAITQISQAADTDLDAQSQILQAQNAFEDTFRSGEELRKQLPKLQASGNIPSIPVELDLSTVANNKDVKALNSEIDKGVSATEDLSRATETFNSTVSDGGDLINDNTSATQNLEGSVSSVSGAMDLTVTATENLNTTVSSTTDSAQYLQNQIDTNTTAVDSTNTAMQAVGASLDANTQKTIANIEQTSVWHQWLGEKGIGGAVANVLVSITNISAGIMDGIAKTVDWFKTFANNIPILNQVGQTIAGWGQQIAQSAVGQAVGGAIQGAGNLINQGVGAIQGALGMGPGVGNVGKFNIVEATPRGIEKVTQFRDLEKHHPRSGREAGRNYSTIEGELEEVRNTKDGRTLIKKDFVLSKNGSQNVDIPAFAAGYIKRLNDAVNTVQIYADKEMTKLIGQSLHMNNVPVKTGDYVKYGQSIGKQSGAGGYPVHAHIEMELERFKQYIADLNDGTFQGVTGKEQAHTLGDGHNHFGEEDAKKANQGVASVATNAQSMLASMPQAAMGNSQVVMRRTGQLDDKGLEKLAVSVVNSQGQIVKSFTANSGKANTQNKFGGAGSTTANSNAPLEYGTYNIGQATAGATAAVGKTFIPIDPQFKTARSSLGIHWDADRPVGAGSAGCIVFATEAEFKAFQAAIKANGVNSLVFEGQNAGNKVPKTIAPPQVASQQKAASVPQASGASGRFTMPLPTGGNLKSGANQNVPSWMPKLSWEQHKQFLVNQAMGAGITDPNQIRYLLATAEHETGKGMYMREGGSASYLSYLNGRLGNKGTADSVAYRGAGYSQLTGKDNFVKWSPIVSKHFGQNIDLVNNPDLAAHPDIAAFILAKGMKEGSITGRSIGNYINTGAGKVDFRNARRTINGIDSRQLAKIDKVLAGLPLSEVQQLMANAQKGGGGVPMQAVAQATGGQAGINIQAPQAFVPTAPMTVWEPGSLKGATSASTGRPLAAASVATSGNARITEAQSLAQQQRDQQQQAAAKQALVQAESGTIQGLQKGYQSLQQVEKQLRQSGYETRDLFEDIGKMNLESQGPLALPEQRQQRVQELTRQFRDSREKVREKIIDVQSRQTSAQAILEQPGGVLTPAVREKFNKLLSMPIADDLKARLQEAMTSGVFGDQLRNVLQKSVSQGNQEIATLQKASQALETGEKGALKAAQERFDFEEKARANAAKFEQKGLDIATLQARLENVKGKADREGPFSEAAKQLPALESLIALQQQQLDYDKQIQEIEEKVRNKTGINENEAKAQIASIKERKGIAEQTIRENQAYQELTKSREIDNRNREVGLQAAKDELAVQKQQLEGLKSLPTTDPRRAQIPLQEHQIELQELQLKLQEEIAAVNESVFKDPTSKTAGDARIAKLKEEYDLNVKNLGTRLKQQTVEQELAQQRAIIGIREQELGFTEQLLEAQTRSIELGRSSGDTLGDRYKLQADQQKLGFEKQILDVKELAAQSGKSAEEVAAIEAQLQKVNDIKLDNIQGEMQKAFQDRAIAVQQRIGDSTNSVLSAQQSLLSTTGQSFEASRIGKKIAINQQQMDFTSQTRELEEFIKTNAVASEQANTLRSNLASVNDIKFQEIQAQFNPLKGVVDGVAGSLKGAFKSLIKDGKVDIKSFFDGILDSIADFLSNMLVEKLMGFLNPKKKGKPGIMPGGEQSLDYADALGLGKNPLQPEGTKTAAPNYLSALGLGENPLTTVDAGLTKLGTSQVTPMYVSVVNANQLGFAQGQNNIVPFNAPNMGGGLGAFGSMGDILGGKTDFISAVMGSASDPFSAFTATSPLPVNVAQAKPDLFSSLLGGGGAGGGGLGGILGSLGGMLGGGGAGGGMGGGFGGIIGSLLPMVGSLFGGIFATGGIIGSGKGQKDDQLILAQRGEGILTHDGMKAIGGAAALNAINRTKGYKVPKFAAGGVIGGEYGGKGSADAVERANSERMARRSDPIKLETTVINNVEYATKEQVATAMQQAKSDGAREGVKYVQNKMENSVSWRNRHGIR
jgi:tape measure domain-containing protein